MNMDTVITALTDADRDVRMSAALAIGTDHLVDAAEPLVARLGHEDDATVRETLTWACVHIADVARPKVVALLASPEAATRMQAAHVLSKIADPSLADQLDGAIADPDEQVAVKAFRAAAATGSDRVVDPLFTRLGSGDRELRDALATAFATLARSEQAAPTVVEALTAALEDADDDVRIHALECLAQVGTPVADEAAPHVGAMLAEDSAELRLAAVMALGAMDPEVAADMLSFAATHEDARVAAAATSLLARGASTS